MTQLAMDAKQREADRKNGVTNKPQQMKKGDVPWNNQKAPYKNVPAYKKPTFNTGMSGVLQDVSKNGMRSNFAPSSSFAPSSMNPIVGGYEQPSKPSGVMGGLASLFGVQTISDFVGNSNEFESNFTGKGASMTDILETNKRKVESKKNKKVDMRVNKPVTMHDIITNPKVNTSKAGVGVLKTPKQKSNGGKTGNKKGDKPQQIQQQSNNMENYSNSSNGGMGGVTGSARELHVKVIQDGIVKGNTSINGGTAKAGTYAALINMSKLLGRDFKHSAAVRDQYHESKSAGSYHNKGLAFDISIHSGRNGKSSAGALNIYNGHMRSCGMASNEYYLKDEYKSPSANSTGGHIHFNFMNDAAADKYYQAQSGQSAINDGGGGADGVEGSMGDMFDNPYKTVSDAMTAIFTSDNLDGLREIMKVTKADKTNNPAEMINPHSAWKGKDEYAYKDFGRGVNKNGTMSENLSRLLKGNDDRQLADRTGIKDTRGFTLNKDRQLKDTTGIKDTTGFKENSDRQYADTDAIKNGTGFKGNNDRQGSHGKGGKLSWLSKFLNGDIGNILGSMFPQFGDIFGLLGSGDYVGAATGILKGMSGKNDPLIIGGGFGGGQYGEITESTGDANNNNSNNDFGYEDSNDSDYQNEGDTNYDSDGNIIYGDSESITYIDDDNTLTNEVSTSNNPYHTVYMDGDNIASGHESDSIETRNISGGIKQEQDDEQPYYENLYNGGIDVIEPDDVLSDRQYSNDGYGFESPSQDRQGDGSGGNSGFEFEPVGSSGGLGNISGGGFGGGMGMGSMTELGGLIGNVIGGLGNKDNSGGSGRSKYDIFANVIGGLSSGGGFGDLASNLLDGRTGKQAMFGNIMSSISGGGFGGGQVDIGGMLQSNFMDGGSNTTNSNIQGLLGNIISNVTHSKNLSPQTKENSDVLTKISQMQFSNNMMMKAPPSLPPTILQPPNNAPTRVNGVSDGATIPISVRNNDSPIKEIAKSYLRNSM